MWQVCASACCNHNLRYRMPNHDFIQIHLPFEQGDDLEPDRQLVCLQQRRSRLRFRAMHSYPVRVSRQGRELDREILNLDSSTNGIACRMLDLLQYKLMERRTAQQEVNGQTQSEYQSRRRP